MADFLSNYSVQQWLESCPQGYLMNTQYGHDPDAVEAKLIRENEVMRTETIRTTVQLVVGERCALAASSGLINAAPDEASKRFLATQTLDEARHVEIFTQRLYDLGVKKADLENVLDQYVNPNLVKFAEILLEKVDKKDFVAGVVGQNIVLEGMAFSVFEMLHAMSRDLNPKFADTLSGTIADERRHVGFGENRIGSLIREHPDRKPEVEQMQKDMSYFMLATFADGFRDNPMRKEVDRLEAEMAGEAGVTERKAIYRGVDIAHMEPEKIEGVLAETVLKEFKVRLARIGLEYQSPDRP